MLEVYLGGVVIRYWLCTPIVMSLEHGAGCAVPLGNALAVLVEDELCNRSCARLRDRGADAMVQRVVDIARRRAAIDLCKIALGIVGVNVIAVIVEVASCVICIAADLVVGRVEGQAHVVASVEYCLIPSVAPAVIVVCVIGRIGW